MLSQGFRGVGGRQFGLYGLLVWGGPEIRETALKIGARVNQIRQYTYIVNTDMSLLSLQDFPLSDKPCGVKRTEAGTTGIRKTSLEDFKYL